MPVPDAPSIDATFQTKDGHTIASEETTVLPTGSGTFAFNITISRLRYVHRVFRIQRNTNPVVDAGVVSYTDIQGNVVGVTLMNVGGGTTMTALFTAIGI